jgi:diguanylate cyclase
VTAGVLDEIGQVTATIDAAAGTVATYRDDLARLVRELDGLHDRRRLSVIVDGLLQATRSHEATNEAFMTALKASRQDVGQLREKAEMLRNDSITDPLTGLANRQCFERELDRRIAEAEPANDPLCLLVMDIDHLDKINGTFGHMAGDQVLRVVSHSLKQHVQQNDVAARIGGEEFAVLLPKIPLRSALTVGDHIRCRVMAMQFIKRSTGESMGRVTISGGIARYRRGETPWALMERADHCLTAAKRHGRNLVICDDDELVRAA